LSITALCGKTVDVVISGSVFKAVSYQVCSCTVTYTEEGDQDSKALKGIRIKERM